MFLDIVGLDRNKIVSIDKWGTKTVDSGEGCGRGQRCDYVAGEVTIKEEGTNSKQGQQEAEKAKGEGNDYGRRGLWLRLQLLRMKAVTTSKGDRKQGSSRGGRCNSKDGRGRVSKAKGTVKAATGRGGRKRAATVVGGWQWRWKKAGDMMMGRGYIEEGVAGRQQQ
ncbi:hypothetical protein BHE74_00025843 [Ensete ventricosum]|nr:hypothetical protein BHE74_00025843 [Ensete ventricosum]RZR99832.1 hypothetical protein BHM03_00029456 [Ensete ventricosum]